MDTPASTADPRRDAAHDWLMGRINYERTGRIPYGERHMKLDRMRQLLNRLGNPDRQLKIIHIAGTKGKGSTATLISAILRAAGLRVGVFSSPHLERIEERFAVDGTACSADEFAALVERLQPIVGQLDLLVADGQPGPTYFDLTTAIALEHFANHRVDAAVLEVGLGGRLDSTNVCLPVVSVVTSISFDHTKQLGNSLAAIAAEKAGIIKPGVPVVSGVIEAEPAAVISEVAQRHGCRLLQLGTDFHSTWVPPANLNFRHPDDGSDLELIDVPLAMSGRHQAANAAVALATVLELRNQGWCVSRDAMRAGLGEATVPARIEVVRRHPTVVLDTAHNRASAQALVDTLAACFPQGNRTLVLAVSRDKDVRAIVDVLAPHFARIVATEFQTNPRAIPAERLAQIAGAHTTDCEVAVLPDPVAAYDFAERGAQSDEMIVIAGSFFIAAELRPLLTATAARPV